MCFAMQAAPALQAVAFKAAHTIATFSTIQARIAGAIIYVSFTKRASKAIATGAFKFVVQIQAAFSAHWIAGITQAFINFCFTAETHKSWSAFANKAIQLIHAGGAILTRIRFAVIYGMLTVLARIAWFTIAVVAINQIHAGAIIQARSIGAVININVTGSTSPAGMAYTFMVKQTINTGAMFAGL